MQEEEIYHFFQVGKLTFEEATQYSFCIEKLCLAVLETVQVY